MSPILDVFRISRGTETYFVLLRGRKKGDFQESCAKISLKVEEQNIDQ